MNAEEVRAGAGWLALREPADAAARSPELVATVRSLLPTGRRLVVHDLGSGSGAMSRWLARRLPGPQHWVLHDRDAELLELAGTTPPAGAPDGSRVTVETRHDDITRLERDALAAADLVTASALLDMLTTDELDRLVTGFARVGCPVLVTLSVTGLVELAPHEPLDDAVAAAFNAHQRLVLGGRRLLGPDAVDAAVEGLRGAGMTVETRPSPWRLGPADAGLATAWFDGWLAAAHEQRPDLVGLTGSYARARRAAAAAGRLPVVVHHRDLLAVPT